MFVDFLVIGLSYFSLFYGEAASFSYLLVIVNCSYVLVRVLTSRNDLVLSLPFILILLFLVSLLCVVLSGFLAVLLYLSIPILLLSINRSFLLFCAALNWVEVFVRRCDSRETALFFLPIVVLNISRFVSDLSTALHFRIANRRQNVFAKMMETVLSFLSSSLQTGEAIDKANLIRTWSLKLLIDNMARSFTLTENVCLWLFGLVHLLDITKGLPL